MGQKWDNSHMSKPRMKEIRIRNLSENEYKIISAHAEEIRAKLGNFCASAALKMCIRMDAAKRRKEKA